MKLCEAEVTVNEDFTPVQNLFSEALNSIPLLTEFIKLLAGNFSLKV